MTFSLHIWNVRKISFCGKPNHTFFSNLCIFIVLYIHRFLISLPLAHYFPFSGFVNICLFFPSNVTKKTKPTQEQLTLNTKCGCNVSLQEEYIFSAFSLVHLIAPVYKSNIGFLIVICLIISYYKDNNYPLFHYWKILLTQHNIRIFISSSL